MAEKSEKPSESKKKREIKDAGQRIVFAALDFDVDEIARQLAVIMQAPGLPGSEPKPPTKTEIEWAKKLLTDKDGRVTLWVPIGEVDGGKDGIDKADAIEKVVDEPMGREVPGRYRAPTKTAWRGEERRVRPSTMQLDRQLVD
ncbi:MAG TPA: hypothetical protein VGV69_03460 [Solirubrobacterales bacterium]|nr:hypothetical protein [Solirubrobacterales bacterium]